MKGKFKNLETGDILTANGNTENKTVMGKEFILAQCTDQNGKCFLIPVQRLSNINFFTPIN